MDNKYSKLIRQLFTNSSIEELIAYEKELKTSGNTYSTIQTNFNNKLNNLKANILFARQKIFYAKNIEHKKDLSNEIKSLQNLKAELIKSYEEKIANRRFNNLSNDAKTCACTTFLLKKYLPYQFLENVNIETFSNDASHIRDYVYAYIAKYPKRVKGPKYFVGKLKSIDNFRELTEVADNFFDEENKSKSKKIDKSKKILQSKFGIKTLKEYPQNLLQAVEITEPGALDYEGAEMGHCVASSYKDKFIAGTTKIYSIRELNTDECVPHVTIRVEEGCIKEVKGKNNKMVKYSYINPARDFLCQLTGSANINELLLNPDFDKNNFEYIGYFKDAKNNICDIYNLEEGTKFSRLTIKADDIDFINAQNINVDELCIKGKINSKTIEAISSFASIKKLRLNEFSNDDDNFELDLSNIIGINEISLNAKDKEKKYNIKFPEMIKKVSLESICFDSSRLPENIEVLETSNSEIQLNKFKHLKEIQLSNCTINDNDLEALKDIEKIVFFQCNINTKSFNLEDYKSLESIEIGNSDFPKTKDFKLNEDISNIDLKFCHFAKLEKLDFSQYRKIKEFRNPAEDFMINLSCDIDFGSRVEETNIPEKCKPQYYIFSITAPNLKELNLLPKGGNAKLMLCRFPKLEKSNAEEIKDKVKVTTNFCEMNNQKGFIETITNKKQKQMININNKER